MRQIRITIKPKEERLDKYLSKSIKNLTRSQVKKLIKQGFILVNEVQTDPDYGLRRGDVVKIKIPEPKPAQVLPENLPLKIVYEDEDLLVVDKEAGVVVHPTLDHPGGTLVNALLHHLKKNLPGREKSVRPGIVHRLDKGTSGLVVVAKNQTTLENLKSQFKSRTVKKKYLLLVSGKLEPKSGVIDKPIGRHRVNRKKFTLTDSGKEAITKYLVLEYIGPSFSLVEAEPKTGRTHQIRVHFSSIGHTIIGDKLYGGKSAARIFLHAAYLEFVHPGSGKKVSFSSPLPSKLVEILGKIRKRNSSSK